MLKRMAGAWTHCNGGSGHDVDDDNFDVEAYKKWRLEHPDSDTPVEDDDEEELEFDEGGES